MVSSHKAICLNLLNYMGFLAFIVSHFVKSVPICKIFSCFTKGIV